MSRVLSMCEWWLLLTMELAEIEEVARFKTLSREQRLMIESARKEPGKFTEAVLLSAKGQMLMRNVPPPLAIALAMTEGEEKAERRRIMKDLGCDELGAAIEVARRIATRDLVQSPEEEGGSRCLSLWSCLALSRALWIAPSSSLSLSCSSWICRRPLRACAPTGCWKSG